jgi:hypothetical protein
MNLSIQMFDAPRARATDPSTSHAAAKRSMRFSASHAGRIHLALIEHGNMSAVGIAGMTGLTVVQVDRRLPDLARSGLAAVVVKDGAPLVWGNCRVWSAVE